MTPLSTLIQEELANLATEMVAFEETYPEEDKAQKRAVLVLKLFKESLTRIATSTLQAVELEGCCKECFVPEHDALRGPDYMISEAVGEHCAQEDCPCHLARQKQAELGEGFIGN